MNILPIDSVAGSLPGRPDRASHVGMRPEDLELTDPGSGLVSGRVLLSEYTGASSLLHVELPSGEVFLVAYDGQTIDADTALGLHHRAGPIALFRRCRPAGQLASSAADRL